MIKAILFDADGMIINRPMRFSERMMTECDVPADAIVPFFRNEFQQCLIGQADLKVVVQPYLAKWNWNKSIDDLLRYWFKNENFVDVRVVAEIQSLRSKGLKCYIHSNQEKYRTEYMINEMHLDQIVDGIFSSANLGAKKPEQKFWQSIFDQIQPMTKEEVLVWDDDQKMADSAKAFGFNVELYQGFDSFAKTISNL